MDAVDIASLLLRISVGATLFAHGWNHVFRGGKIAGTGRWFESIGLRPGWLHAWMASLTELVGGVMLITGLLTPLAAAGAVGTMLVALISNHWKNGFFIFRPGEGWEYVGMITVVAVAIGALGGGDVSLDAVLDIEDEFLGRDGAIVAGGLGAIGAALVLISSWRPTRKPAP